MKRAGLADGMRPLTVDQMVVEAGVAGATNAGTIADDRSELRKV
jgi:hypothetical protein